MKIKDFLAPSQVVIDLRASDKARLLDELARRAAAASGLDAQTIASALSKREKLGSTGTGGGVAIPHARMPGIDKPVDLVFLLLLPAQAQGEQIHALACAARALRDAEVLRSLRRAVGSADAYRALVANGEQ